MSTFVWILLMPRNICFMNTCQGPDGRLGELDPASFHGGCSVWKGEKWIANYWIEIEPPFCAGVFVCILLFCVHVLHGELADS